MCVLCEKEGEVLSREEVLVYLQQEADETFMKIYFFKSFTIGGLLGFFTFFDRMTPTLKILVSKNTLSSTPGASNYSGGVCVPR